MKFQDYILMRLGQEAKAAGSQVHVVNMPVNNSPTFENLGSLIAIQHVTLTTLGRLRYEFDRDRVRIQLNGASHGQRSEDVFWWIAGDPDDDDEVRRLLARWRYVVQVAYKADQERNGDD